MPRPRLTPTRGASLLVYVVLLLAALMEKFGDTTHDTKTPLVETPGEFLRGAISLWNPDTSLGEIQNQAYGYLFPQGPFYVLGELAQLPPWVTERLWSVAVLVIGCEGARLLAKAFGLPVWAAWVAGMAYGLNPHVMSQVATRSAEVLPGAVLPWVVLPVVLAMTGRLGVRRAALFSAAAFAFSGGVNGTATAAPLVLVIVILVWGVRTDRASGRLLAWWSGLVVLTSAWWIVSLLRLNAYAPPFFDYVEDTSATTGPTGYASSLRGTSNWVSYIYTGAYPSWPAGAELAQSVVLVLLGGLVAAAGVVGLACWRSPWRTPLLASAAVALAALTVGHSWPLGSPIGAGVRDLLDGPFALLRNVHKIDPPLRLPLAIGVGVSFVGVTRWASRRRPALQKLAPAVLVGVVLGLAQPAVALDLRTPGWDEVPGYWHEAADFLAEQPRGDDVSTWVVPGSGFGIQTWGWTQDEPMAAVATTPWFTRSQVPLVPPVTIRMLSRLESFIDTGSGSPNLGPALSRLGVGYVLVRHDLDPTLTEATSSNLVSIALARSPDLERVAQFGALEYGPALEIYAVRSTVAGEFSVSPTSDVVTVAGAAPDVLEAIGAGLIEQGQSAIVQGDDGWDRAADIAGDAYRDRERDFGRVHDTEGPVLAPGEPRRSKRKVANYPSNPGSQPLVADYEHIAYVDASSSQAFVGTPTAVLPETAPFAAVDGDPLSGWHTEYFSEPEGQWLEIHFDQPRLMHRIGLVSSIADTALDDVTSWRVSAGGRTEDVEVDPFNGRAEVDLGGVTDDSVRFTVTGTEARGQITLSSVALLEVEMTGLPARRTLVEPATDLAEDVDYVFTAQPETRACITTLLGPDCQFQRRRQAEESIGIDRTITVPESGTWRLEGSVLARARPATAELLMPFEDRMRIRASSSYASDPAVSVRMAYDGDGTTSWIADPYDRDPTLYVELDRPRTVRELDVTPPTSAGIVPTVAVVSGGGETREVDLRGLGRFEPIKAKRFSISLDNPTRGVTPVGVSELRIEPGGNSVTFAGDTETGSVCGFGPVLEVDGERYPTRVAGLMGDVVAGGPLSIVPCDDGALRLSAGRHRVRLLSTEQFQPVTAILRRQGGPDVAATPEDRGLEVVSQDDTQQVLRVGEGEESVLGTTRNTNRGWVATLDGQPLEVQQVDGWAQGWIVPAGNGGTIEIEFAPERSYVFLLVVGLGVTLLVLLLALVLLVRTRLEPGAPVDDAPPRPAWSWPRSAATWVAAGLVCWVVGGVPALAGVVMALVLLRWQRARVPLAALLLVAAAVVAAVTAWSEGSGISDVADALAGAGFVLALVASAARPRVGPRHRAVELESPVA